MFVRPGAIKTPSASKEYETQVSEPIVVTRTIVSMLSSARRQFDYEAVAPAVLGIKERLHSGREPRRAVIVHDAPDGIEFSVADPDLDPRLRLDVAYTIGALAFGNKVEVSAVLAAR